MRFLLNEFEKIVCAVLFLGMTLIGFINVVVRYATHYSFAASEELLTNGFLLLTVFGAAIAARRGQRKKTKLKRMKNQRTAPERRTPEERKSKTI